ncbi:MAG: cupin domain-containing protein [Deltaproteobacteria bacterium]|nr:cupin domain-containing protein [Deltaproteobacteria bacterium]
MSEAEILRDLDRKLRGLSVEGLWSPASDADMATYSKDPHTTVLPHVWKWPALYEAIQTVASMHGLDGLAERRVLRLINPAYLDQHNRRQRTTTHTMLMTLQLLKPGEVAHDHRHNFAAFRFILKGAGAYTVVEGEQIPMAAGDLILTPSMTWHGHRNGGEPVVWLDGLDNPLLFLLQSITWEAYPGGLQPMKASFENTAPRIGATRPLWEKSAQRPSYNLHYKWRDTYEKLRSLSAGTGSPFDGIALEYVNPEGGHTMPTMSCAIQMLRPGEATRTHRHNYSVVYHAFRGSGVTVIDGQRFEWDEGDCFVVPLWSWHSHENRSKSDEAILFSVSDLPVMEALKLLREEAA